MNKFKINTDQDMFYLDSGLNFSFSDPKPPQQKVVTKEYMQNILWQSADNNIDDQSSEDEQDSIYKHNSLDEKNSIGDDTNFYTYDSGGAV